MFLRADRWSSGRAVECDCPESSRGASPRRFESSLLREPRMEIVPMRARGLAGVPRTENTGMDWWAVRQRRSPAKTVGGGSPWRVRLSHHPLADQQCVRPRDRAWNPVSETGWIGMAERSRAYVSDAFAHIPPWCKRQHTGLWNLWSWFESRRRSLAAARRIDFPSTLDSMFVVPAI